MPADRSGRVAGVVLAAGTSSRMGANKLLFDLEGEPLVRRAVRRAVAAGLDPVVVVLGHEAARVREAVQGLRCEPVVNADYAEGINVSVRAGLDALADDVAAAMIVLADMPFVTERMMAALIERYRTGTAPLVISAYGDVNAPPMLYDRSLFEELRTMREKRCGREVVRRHRDEAVTVAWSSDTLADLDVPEDYERVRAALAES